MNRTTLIVIGIVVLGVLGYFVYRQSQQEQAAFKPKPAAELPTIAAGDDIDKISIKDGKKDEIVFERKGGGGDAGAGEWVMVKPVSAPANQMSVKDVVTNLKDLKIDRQVELKLDDQVRKDKHLDADQAVRVMAFKGADKKVDLSFGANQLLIVGSQPDKVYATKASGPGAYQSFTYQRELKAWRNTEIWKVDEPTVVGVTIQNKNGEFSFTRGEKGWAGTLKGKPIERFDESKMKDMLQNLQALNADDFGDGKSAADTGLDAPEATVTLTQKDSAGKFTLKVGKVSSGDARYAKRDGNDTTFVISKFTAQDWALADVAKFQKPLPSDAGADAAPKDAKDKPKPFEMPPMMPPGDPHGH